MTRRAAYAVLLVLLLGLVGWLALWGWGGESRVGSVSHDLESGLHSASPSSSLAVESATPESPAESESETVAASATTSGSVGTKTLTAKPAPASPPAAKVKADLQAESPYVFVVSSETDEPLANATVEIVGMRSEALRGAWFPYRGGTISASTDSGGRAVLDVWDWVDGDGRTRSVDLWVSHPDYVQFHDHSFKLSPRENAIRLRRGTLVSLLVSLGSSDRPVQDVEIELERQARLRMDSWTKEPDGRLSTRRIAPGAHVLCVTYRPRDGPRYFSRMIPFTVRDGESVDLQIELEPASVLTGSVDPSVPRPVVDGHVLLCIRALTDGDGNGSLAATYETDIHADGSFRFEDLPPGRGYFFALARGWVSKEAAAGQPDDHGIRTEEIVEPERVSELPAGVLAPQRADIPCGPIVLRMQETGSVEIRVLDRDGIPLPGVTAYVSPNYFLPGVGSGLVPWRTWEADTGGDGRARFEDVPPGELWFGARGPGLRMREKDRLSPPSCTVTARTPSANTVHLELDRD